MSLKLPFRSLNALLVEAPAQPRWLIDGYLAPGSLTLLAGRAKVGKSTLLYAALPSIARGEPFLGRGTLPTRALVLSEEPEDAVFEKGRRFQLEGEDVADVLLFHDVRDASWPEIVAATATRCDETGAKLLVVDTLQTWAGFRGDAENQAGSVLEAIEPLRKATSHDLAILLVAHQRKSGGEYGDAVRGSSALLGAVDVIVELERSSALGDTGRILRAQSRYMATPRELAIDLGEDGYAPIGAGIVDARLTSERESILAALEDRPEGATTEDLVEVTCISRSTMDRRLLELMADKQVSREGSGQRGDPYIFVSSHLPNPKDRVGWKETKASHSTLSLWDRRWKETDLPEAA